MFVKVVLRANDITNRNFDNGELEYTPFNSEVFFHQLVRQLGIDNTQDIIDAYDNDMFLIDYNTIEAVLKSIIADVELYRLFKTTSSKIAQHIFQVIDNSRYAVGGISLKVEEDNDDIGCGCNTGCGCDTCTTEITKEDIELEASSILYLNEMMAKRQIVMRKGEIKVKFQCPSGWKYSRKLNDCEKMQAKELYELGKRAKRAARTRKLHDTNAAKTVRERERRLNSMKKTSIVGSFLN